MAKKKDKLQKALEAREDKVSKQRKKSKGGLGYTAIGAAAGAIPFAGAASKAISAIAKGVKTIKAGMKASKAKNPRGAMQQINPKSSLINSKTTKSSAKTTKPSQAWHRRQKELYGPDTAKAVRSTLKQPIMIKFKKDGEGLRKAVSKGSKNTVKKKAGGKVKGYKKGGPITYRMAGGQVVDNSYD